MVTIFCNDSTVSCAKLVSSSTAFMDFPIICVVFLTASEDFSANILTSFATTAKPLPASPALAASMAAFNARRFVCFEISQ